MSSGKRAGFLENIIKNLREGFTKDEKLKVGEGLQCGRQWLNYVYSI